MSDLTIKTIISKFNKLASKNYAGIRKQYIFNKANGIYVAKIEFVVFKRSTSWRVTRDSNRALFSNIDKVLKRKSRTTSASSYGFKTIDELHQSIKVINDYMKDKIDDKFVNIILTIPPDDDVLSRMEKDGKNTSRIKKVYAKKLYHDAYRYKVSIYCNNPSASPEFNSFVKYASDTEGIKMSSDMSKSNQTRYGRTFTVHFDDELNLLTSLNYESDTFKFQTIHKAILDGEDQDV